MDMTFRGLQRAQARVDAWKENGAHGGTVTRTGDILHVHVENSAGEPVRVKVDRLTNEPIACDVSTCRWYRYKGQTWPKTQVRAYTSHSHFAEALAVLARNGKRIS